MNEQPIVKCYVCGVALVTWESAQTKVGLRLVCIDGEACAKRANAFRQKPRLVTVGDPDGRP